MTPAHDHTRHGEHEHRVRLLQAMGELAGQRGYAATTIADIVRVAGVSKRSFYEHFDSKQACFLALYLAASASALRVLREAVNGAQPWRLQLEHALDAYFGHLASAPELLKTLFVEIHHLGEAGTRVRREVMQQMVDFMLFTVEGRGQAGTFRGGGALADAALTPEMAMAAVGGINELILQSIEDGAAGRLQQLTPTASLLVGRLAGLRAEPGAAAPA